MKTHRRDSIREQEIKFRIQLFAIFVAVISILFFVSELERKKDTVARTKATYTALRKIVDDHHYEKVARGVRDHWWMETRPGTDVATFKQFEQKAAEIKNILALNQDVSTEMKAVATKYKKITTAVWFENDAQILHIKDEPIIFDRTNSVLVCYLSRADAIKEDVFTPRWSTKRQIVFIPALEIPAPLRPSIFCHELGHARRHNSIDGKPDAATIPEYVTEEVEMHELGGLVLNKTSGGKYHAKLDEILKRSNKAKTPYEAITLISMQDCKEIDAMFGCSEVDLPSNMLISQALLEIGLKYCDSKNLGMKGKIALYNWFDEYIYTVK